MRTFFAIKAPDLVLDHLSREIAILRKSIPAGVKWTPREQMHLTMKFIGSFSPDDLEPIKIQFEKQITSYQPITLTFSNIGIFPPKGKPRVIWWGFHANQRLMDLAELIETSCGAFGYPREKRPFSPHLTIGRVKRQATDKDQQAIKAAVDRFKPSQTDQFQISKLFFIQSTLTPAGPEYSTLFSIDI